MIFQHIDKIESNIISIKELTIKAVATVGIKNSNSNKMSSIYSKSYQSQKYVSPSSISTLYINASKYLVFSYFDKQDTSNREEIYLSYPHLTGLRDFFKGLANFLNTDDLILEDDESEDLYFNEKYSEVTFKLENLANGKSMMAIPNIVTDTNGEDYLGCDLCLNSETCYVSLTQDNIITIYSILKDLNLENIIASNIMIGMMFEQFEEQQNLNNNQQSPKTKKPLKPIRRTKSVITSNTKDDIADDSLDLETPMDYDSIAMSIDIDDDDEKPTKKVVKTKKSEKDEIENLFDDDEEEETKEPKPKSKKGLNLNKLKEKEESIELEDLEEE